MFAMKAHMSARRSPIFILLIWIIAVGLSSPLLVYRQQLTREWQNHTEIWCADTWPEVEERDPVTHQIYFTTPSKTYYYTFVSIVLFFYPIIVMSMAYSLIMWKLWSSKLPGEHIETELRNQTKLKKKVIIMLVTLLFMFVVCWLPFQVIILFSEHRANKNEPLPGWYREFTFFANFIAYANSAINPIIYTGFNLSFRRGFRAAFRCKRQPKKRYSAVSGISREMSNTNLSTTGVTKI